MVLRQCGCVGGWTAGGPRGGCPCGAHLPLPPCGPVQTAQGWRQVILSSHNITDMFSHRETCKKAKCRYMMKEKYLEY